MVFSHLLVRVFAATGLVIGLAGGAVWHWARLDVGGFTVFAATENAQFAIPTHHPSWWPSLLIFTLGGLVIGTAAGVALAQLGWSMIRTPRTRP